MPGTSSLFDFILQLLASPALAQSFLSDPDGTNDAIDTHAIATRSTAHRRYVAPHAAQASSRSSCTSLSCSIVSV